MDHNPFYSDSYSLMVTMLNMMGLKNSDFNQHCRDNEPVEIINYLTEYFKERSYSKLLNILK